MFYWIFLDIAFKTGNDFYRQIGWMLDLAWIVPTSIWARKRIEKKRKKKV